MEHVKTNEKYSARKQAPSAVTISEGRATCAICSNTFPRRGKVHEGRMGDAEADPGSVGESPIRSAAARHLPLRGKVGCSACPTHGDRADVLTALAWPRSLLALDRFPARCFALLGSVARDPRMPMAIDACLHHGRRQVGG